ncbi:hypothetical protein SUDANB126_00500 [Streptomyces sp. enrichment culture]
MTVSSDHVCSSCGKPVDTVLERHKTMGVFAPLWATDPCRNPDCARYEPERTAHETERTADETVRKTS